MECGKEATRRAMHKNGDIPCSLQQQTIQEWIGGEINYVVGPLALDIAFPDQKLYVEYDGSGHDLAVKMKTMSRQEFDEKQKRRTYSLYREGWKCIRFISRHDYFPEQDVFMRLYNEAREILQQGHSYCEYDFDLKTIEFGQVKTNVDLGKMHRVRTDQ